MGQRTKTQTFPYSFKTVATGDTTATGFGTSQNKLGLEIINPQDFYACQQLFAHFRFLHDATVAGRNVTSVSITDSIITPTFTKTVNATFSAVSLVVDIKIDLVSIRNEFGTNIVVFTFDGAISGTIQLFKLDMLYQVIGIR